MHESTFSSLLGELPADSGASLSLDGGEWDPNMLLEALMDDNGDGRTARATAPVDQPASDPQPQQKKPKKNKNKARDERRFLLAQLREEAQRLQFTLDQLRSIRSKRRQPQGKNDHSSLSTTAQDVGVPAVWQEICARQLQRRMNAERENIQLKSQLEKEKELANSLAKLLYRRKTPKTQGPEAQKLTRRTDIPPGYIERMSAFIFEELSAGVEELSRQVKELCHHEQGVLEISSSFPAVQRPLLRDGVKGREEKLLDTRVLPFSIQAAGDAWWHNWHLHRGRNIQETAGDMVVERFGLDMSDFNANTSVTSYGQQILKRGVDDHRILFVWNAYMEPFLFENEHISGLYFLEQCLVLITPDQGGGDHSSSCMSTCYVITPYVLDPKLRDDPKTGALIDFFVGSLFSTIKGRCEMVEDMLFDQALEKFN